MQAVYTYTQQTLASCFPKCFPFSPGTAKQQFSTSIAILIKLWPLNVSKSDLMSLANLTHKTVQGAICPSFSSYMTG